MGLKLNRSGLAEAQGVSLPTIDRWVKDGMPVGQRGSRGVEWVFDLADVIRWRIERATADANAGAPDDLAAIEKRTAQAKMLTAELELAKKKGEVAPVRDFERAQAKVFAQIRANVMNVPQRCVIQLLGETDETIFKDKLRKELTLALQAAAEADLTLEDEDDDSEGDD
ncbi:terminase small subunit [Bradyrhizobium sp. BWC-3-1]|uniref:terminase small subunit n=1 Tax=Bradyrhizobium sp. BWC-3-1 TaxID=3080012 RepID=UPI00293F0B8F|nr:terminase small subunit [Bradyrhizobium sp. BWC-3-1]WOH61918.1 terminase small subunit [Bradyrhizobium sp. BWC-3-1]